MAFFASRLAPARKDQFWPQGRAEFAFASQPEESASRMVMENSARVWRCDANRPLVLAMAVWVTPVVKMPAAVLFPFLGHFSLRGRLPSASGPREMHAPYSQSSARPCCIFEVLALAAGPEYAAGCAPGFLRVFTTRRNDSSSVLFVVARAVRPSSAMRTGIRSGPARLRSGESYCWQSASARRIRLADFNSRFRRRR